MNVGEECCKQIKKVQYSYIIFIKLIRIDGRGKCVCICGCRTVHLTRTYPHIDYNMR